MYPSRARDKRSSGGITPHNARVDQNSTARARARAPLICIQTPELRPLRRRFVEMRRKKSSLIPHWEEEKSVISRRWIPPRKRPLSAKSGIYRNSRWGGEKRRGREIVIVASRGSSAKSRRGVLCIGGERGYHKFRSRVRYVDDDTFGIFIRCVWGRDGAFYGALCALCIAVSLRDNAVI